MISYSIIISLILDIIICFVLPIVTLIILQNKYMKTIKSFIFGGLAFLISQMVFRVPIVTVFLPSFTWFANLQKDMPYLYWIFLGLTAGIAEEIMRYIFIKYSMKNNQRFVDNISFGIGHGAIEAMLITGLSIISALASCIMINKGTFSAYMASAPQETTTTIYNQCINLTVQNVLLGGVERIFAMFIHIGLTTVVFSGIRKNKGIAYLLLAILIHTVIDSSIGFMTNMFKFSPIAIEAIFGVIAIMMVAYCVYSYKHVSWQANENNRLNDRIKDN